ncbi:MAG: DedA family protein [Blastocatellia bacterium]|nr:DedA family protein [Blastocatellia bacterium]
MIESLIVWLQQLPPGGVLLFMFFVAYIENVFPPSPSDVLILFAGTLISVGTVGFPESLAVTTLGSVTGFMTAYLAGRNFERVMETRLGRWLPVGAIEQVERLFQRYGYGVIIANRFLAGTRAVVSFFAGMSKMNLPLTTALCAVSAAVWNTLLLYLGMVFGKNWRRGAEYIETYSKVATAIVFTVIVVLVWRYVRRRRAGMGTK